MKPTHGPAPDIIAQALALGLLCRPTNSPRVGCGEALEVTRDCFWIYIHGESPRAFSVSPDELLQTWELTTKDLVRDEWNRARGEPW